jgi:hypothetical protein
VHSVGLLYPRSIDIFSYLYDEMSRGRTFDVGERTVKFILLGVRPSHQFN